MPEEPLAEGRGLGDGVHHWRRDAVLESRCHIVNSKELLVGPRGALAKSPLEVEVLGEAVEGGGDLVPGACVVHPAALAAWSGAAPLASRGVEAVHVGLDLVDAQLAQDHARGSSEPPTLARLQIPRVGEDLPHSTHRAGDGRDGQGISRCPDPGAR